MGKKEKSLFVCKNCGHTEPRWLGRCPECGSWNTFVEEKAQGKGSGTKVLEAAVPVPLSSIKNEVSARLNSGIKEFDRVIGGGIIKGSAVLVGGEPGIGKSTLMLQIASRLDTKGRILYISGEESPGQVKMRADRLGLNVENIEVLSETGLSSIIDVLNNVKPVMVVVDSIQTLYAEEIDSAPGNVNQIKYCTQKLIEWIKMRDVILLLVAHVTKEGLIAGPKVAEHMVDTVIFFDRGEADVRFLRVNKNRFGSTDELGFFRMTERGLKEITDPASLFLIHRNGSLPPGVAMAIVYEGTRTFLVEIQSLVVPAKAGISRVFSDTIDPRRVSRIAAVLEKSLKLKIPNMDLYVNVAGGMRLHEVGMELPLALSIYSARMNTPLPPSTAYIGEVSLSGEIRSVSHLSKRIKAGSDLKLDKIFVPEFSGEQFAGIAGAKPNAQNKSRNENRVLRVKTIKDAVKKAFGA